MAKLGRPPTLSGTQPKNFLFDEQTNSLLESLSAGTGESQAEIVRRAIRVLAEEPQVSTLEARVVELTKELERVHKEHEDREKALQKKEAKFKSRAVQARGNKWEEVMQAIMKTPERFVPLLEAKIRETEGGPPVFTNEFPTILIELKALSGGWKQALDAIRKEMGLPTK